MRFGDSGDGEVVSERTRVARVLGDALRWALHLRAGLELSGVGTSTTTWPRAITDTTPSRDSGSDDGARRAIG